TGRRCVQSVSERHLQPEHSALNVPELPWWTLWQRDWLDAMLQLCSRQLAITNRPDLVCAVQRRQFHGLDGTVDMRALQHRQILRAERQFSVHTVSFNAVSEPARPIEMSGMSEGQSEQCD